MYEIPEDEMEAYLADLAEDMQAAWDYQSQDDEMEEDEWTRSGLGYGEGIV